MKTSLIIENLRWCVREYGDRDLYFFSRRKATDDSLFLEEITSVHTTSMKVAGRFVPHPTEPLMICGDSGNTFLSEKLVKLNRFGRFIKRFIISNK